jgi:LPS export ABC transporter protein LptC
MPGTLIRKINAFLPRRGRLALGRFGQIFGFNLRTALAASVGGVIFVEIVVLTPAPVEDYSHPAQVALDPTSLSEADKPVLASGIPKGRIPEYSVEDFDYVSTQGGEKQWKLVASQAYLYNKEKLVHSRQIKAFLYDPEGKITIITGKESKYYMNKKDLEVYGDVHAVFPDGFELYSQYLRYRPDIRNVEIPTQYPVNGQGSETENQLIKFESMGFNFQMAKSIITLPERAKLIMDAKRDAKRAPGQTDEMVGVPDRTVIESDRCVIHRDSHVAHFTMSPSRPLASRFVHILQPRLFAKGRRAELRYGDFAKILQYLVAYDDVVIRETDAGKELKYATSGRADFDTHRNVIVLTEFPQAYQDGDTVTGDVILLHRDSDVVEVENGNSFNEPDVQK